MTLTEQYEDIDRRGEASATMEMAWRVRSLERIALAAATVSGVALPLGTAVGVWIAKRGWI